MPQAAGGRSGAVVEAARHSFRPARCECGELGEPAPGLRRRNDLLDVEALGRAERRSQAIEAARISRFAASGSAAASICALNAASMPPSTGSEPQSPLGQAMR